MAAKRERAEEAARSLPRQRESADVHYEVVALACREQWGADWRDLGWATMIYACAGDFHGELAKIRAEGFEGDAVAELQRRGGAGCGFEHRVWLGVGVEGPKDTLDTAYIPCPFVCGTCPECGSALQHDRWNEDERFDPRPIPYAAARFAVPPASEWRGLAEKGYGGGSYHDPSGRTSA